jgi:Undecaprenyl-phosphate galactose phosphotransferase WbaP
MNQQQNAWHLVERQPPVGSTHSTNHGAVSSWSHAWVPGETVELPAGDRRIAAPANDKLAGLELGRQSQGGKRAIDLVLTGLLCVPALLLACVIAVLIKLESRGPVVYRQERVGHRGRRFVVWKFRTMVHNAETVLSSHLEKCPELKDEWHRKHKLRSDPRVTRMGRLLRRTSLDELAQLWNVVRGDMSLVGPRPIVEEETKHYNGHMVDYLSVKPGLTGLWQVSGRNDLSYERRVALDVHYVRNWSVWLDLRILTQTLGVIVRGTGAY